LFGLDRDFVSFWKFIKAEGDIDAALAEFGKFYNASNKPESDKKIKIFVRIFRNLKRLIIKFLNYINNE